MRKLTVIVVAVAVMMWIASMASAEVFSHIMTNTEDDQVLYLDCSFCPGIGPNEFRYSLTNPETNTDSIRGLTLQFPGVDVSDIIQGTTPVGWDFGKVLAESKVFWSWTNFANSSQQLDPGEEFQFSFFSALGFGGGSAGNASAQDGRGYSGDACGPIIPEPMSMLLGAMGLLGIAGFRKVKK